VKSDVSVAVVQMSTTWLNSEDNRSRMVKYVRDICEEGSVDLIVFPELANTGYVQGRVEEFNVSFIEQAERIPGPTTDALSLVAKENEVHIVVGLAELHPQIPATLYNSAVLINSDGQIAGVHHKMHIPAEEKHYFYPGSTTDVFHTDLGTIGLLVCYDSEFPELPRILSLQGAEILIGIFNWGWPRGIYGPGRLSRMAAVRALENKNFFVACGKIGVEDESIFYGNSTIAGPDGEIMIESIPEHDDRESVLRACLSNDQLLRERALNTTYRNRRPELYGLLTEPF
jgi:predicted amidohydrolase